MPIRVISLVLFALTLIFSASVTFAQEVVLEREQTPDMQVAGDFVVGPAKTDIVVNPGESTTFFLTVTNRLGVEKTFDLNVEDIVGSDDPAAGVVLLGEDAGPNSLRDYVSVPVENVRLAHGDQVRIPITITLSQNAGPDGRYGTVVVSTVSDETNSPEDIPSSVIVSRIGSLMFVSTPGEKTLSGNLERFGTLGEKKWFKNSPIQLGILYKNNGNTHLTPYGELRIYNILNQEVGAVDVESWYVLPQSSRLREVTWNKSPLFGRYTAVLTLYNGYEDVPQNATYTFYVVNGWFVVGVLFVAIVAAVLFSYRKKRTIVQ